MIFDFYTFPSYPTKTKILTTDKRLNLIRIEKIGLDTVPSCQIVMPISVRNELYEAVAESGKKRFEVIMTDDHGLKFHGLITEENLIYEKCAWNFKLEHIMAEMRFSHLPANVPHKGEMYVLFQGNRIEMKGWEYVFDSFSKNIYLEYLYSKQDRLEALHDTVIRNTPYCHYQVDLGSRKVYIGIFGNNSLYSYHTESASEYGVQMLTIPEKNIDYSKIVNRLEIISSPTASGMANITVSTLHRKPSLQDPNFPVTPSYGSNLDAEAVQNDDEVSAQFNQVIFFIDDTEGIEAEGGQIYEGAKSDHDLFPVGYDNSPVSEQDREDMAINVYERGMRFLIAHRRNTQVQLDTTYHQPQAPYLGEKAQLRYSPECVGQLTENYYLLGHDIVYPLNGASWWGNVIFDTQLTEFRDMTDRQALVLKALYASSKRSFLIDWQRRSTVQDVGQPDNSQGFVGEPARVHVAISREYQYILSWTMRFALTPIRDSSNNILGKPSSIKIKIDGVDITPQLASQAGANWVNNVFAWHQYFPTREDGKPFNIRTACKDKDPTGALWKQVTEAGIHQFTFESESSTDNGDFGVKIINNVKYSSSNKGI